MNNSIKKGVAVAVILLFIGLAFAPSINASVSKASIDITQDKEIPVVEDIEEPKEYLFQTIIDIANNPDIKKLLDQYNDKLFTSDFDYKGVFKQLLFKNPRLVFSILFTKPSMTYEYLKFIDTVGSKFVNILGMDKLLEIRESIDITNSELSNELSSIITNNEKLSNRISTIEEMNWEFKLDYYFVFICIYLLVLFFTLAIIGYDFYQLSENFSEGSFLWNIFKFCENLIVKIMNGVIAITIFFNCDFSNLS